MSMRQLSEPRTSIPNAIDFPSGAHSMSDGDSFSRVICVGSPSVSMKRTQICGPPGSPGATYAIFAPSGDHFAPEPFVRNRAREPSAFIIQRDASRLSLILSVHVRV